MNLCELVIFSMCCNCWNWWLNLKSGKAGVCVLLLSTHLICSLLEWTNEASDLFQLAWPGYISVLLLYCWFVLLKVIIFWCVNSGILSGKNYPSGAGMEWIFYPSAGTGNPTGKILIWRVRVQVASTHRVRTRCHLESLELWMWLR